MILAELPKQCMSGISVRKGNKPAWKRGSAPARPRSGPNHRTMKRRPAPEFSGHLHFVTTRINHGIKLFRHPTLCREFLDALHDLHLKEDFGLHAYVLMPDHIHLIVQPWDGRISTLMAKIKSLGARRILNQLKEKERSTLLERLKKSSTGKKGHTYQVWQQGFHTVELWSEWFIKGKIDYLHANPMRAGLVKSVKDYPWSSFKAFHGLGGYEIPVDPIPW